MLEKNGMSGLWLAAILGVLLVASGCGDSGTGGGRDDYQQPDTGDDVEQTEDPTSDPVDPVDTADPDDTNGNGTVDTGPDQVTQDPTPDIPPPECNIDLEDRDYPETLQSGARPVRIIFEWLDFTQKRVSIRNVGDTAITFSNQWRFHTHAAQRDLEGTLQPGAQMIFHMGGPGMNDGVNVYFNQITLSKNFEACGGEAAIMHNPTSGGWSNANFVEAYVVWGDRPILGGTATYNDEAYQAEAWSELWTSGSSFRVATCYEGGEQSFCHTPTCTYTDEGIIGTGDITTPAGWTRLTDAESRGCLH